MKDKSPSAGTGGRVRAAVTIVLALCLETSVLIQAFDEGMAL